MGKWKDCKREVLLQYKIIQNKKTTHLGGFFYFVLMTKDDNMIKLYEFSI